MTSELPSERFPKIVRLVHQRDFDRVFGARAVAADGMLIVHAARNGLPHSRLGISVSRRVGNAVHRNYWKRLIRQAFRCQCSLLPGGIDFVVRPQRSAIPEHSGINKSFLTLAKKLDRRLVTPRIER